MCTFFEEALVRVFGGDAVGVDLLEGRRGSRRFCFGGARLRLRFGGGTGGGALPPIFVMRPSVSFGRSFFFLFFAAAGFFLGAGRGLAWRMGTSSSGTNSSSLSSIIILSRCVAPARAAASGEHCCVGGWSLQLALASRSGANRLHRMNYVSTAVLPVSCNLPALFTRRDPGFAKRTSS